MSRILKSFLGKKQNQPSPEEVEALNRATFVLQRRVELIVRQSTAPAASRPAA